MKKRLLSLVLCLVMVFALFPTFAAPAMAADANGITNPDPAKDASKKLNLTKELTPGTEQGSYDLNLESWSTGEVHAYTEKIPTDFVVVVDQSGSMDTTDMPTGTPTLQSDQYLETVADDSKGYYYFDTETQQYYRVYGVKDYLFRYYPANYWYVGDIVERLGQRLSWFMGNTNATANFDNQLYFRETVGNQVYYQPITMTITGRALRYDIRFHFDSKKTNSEYWFDRENQEYTNGHDSPWYHSWLNGGTIDDNWGVNLPVIGKVGYPQVDGAVQGVFTNDREYCHAEFDIIPFLLTARTGMLVNYPMYDRHVGYTKLCYRDVNGVEKEVPSNQNNGQTTWEFCDDSGNARSQQEANSARPTYSNLYKYSEYTDRVTALKQALNQFAQAVANETDSFGAVDNRVSIVGFSGHNHSNTELLTHTERTISGGSWWLDGSDGWQKSTCDNNVDEYYGKALVAPTNGTVGTVNPKIENAIKAIGANGGTQPEDGLNMAYQILTNRKSDQSTWVDGHDLTKEYQIRSGVDKGDFVDRNTIVIFFTDGQPGDYYYSNQYSEANEVVEQAKFIKDYKNTSLFSIGVFGESDGNPLTYNANNEWTKDNQGNDVRISSLNEGYWQYLGGWVQTRGGYCLRRQWRPNTASGYTETPNDTIYDYMSVVSSNYPDAEHFIAQAWLDGNYSGNYIAATDGDTMRHKSSAVKDPQTGEYENQYSRMASSQDTLVAAFLAAVTMNNEETGTPVSINSSAVLQDKVNLDDFDTTNAAATAKVVDMRGNVDSDLTGQLSMNGTNLAQGIVKVSGFDYSKNFVVNGQGKKVVVTITGLTPKNVTGTLYSNKDVKDEDNNDVFGAGLYGSGMDRPVVQIQSPTLVIPGGKDKTYIIDFNASMKVADGAKKLGKTTGTNGDFNVANNEATYKLKGGMSGTTFTASYSGVDTAMIYGVPVGSPANTNAAWNKITTVPASSVYIDDDFASTITVGDGSGYNAQITSATSVTTDADKLDGNYTIQFHGSRIDVYCTTDANAAAVTARVKNNTTQQYVKNLVVSNKFQDDAHGALYNVPTISVDCGSVGDYTLELTVKGTANYRFDGVRIYDPVANENYTGEAASEANATFLKVREQLLPSTVIADINQYFKDKKAYDEAEDKTGMDVPVAPASASNIQGVMFYMDKGASEAGTDNNMKIAAEYGNYGPKNEIYLKKGEGISFSIQNGPTQNMKAWIGLSAPEGGTSDVTVKVGTVDVTPDSNLTAVDMYYPLDGAQNDQTITIQNNGDSLIAITNVKITGSTKGDPGVAQVLSVSDAEPAASVLSAEDGLPYLAVTSKVLSSINAPAQAEDPQPTADPEPTPTQPGFADVIRQLFSSFVNALFGSIARLFGN